MKKPKIYAIALLALLMFASVANGETTPVKKPTKSKNSISKTQKKMLSKSGFRVKGNFTATNGCVFTVDGNYSVLSGFSGTVKVACPGKSVLIYTFEFIINSDNSLEYISGDADAWSAYIANDPDVQQEIIAIINVQ